MEQVEKRIRLLGYIKWAGLALGLLMYGVTLRAFGEAWATGLGVLAACAFFFVCEDGKRGVLCEHIAEDLQEASANTAEYGEFFTGLTGITDRKPVDDALGERIQGYVLGWLEGHPLTAFDDYSATAYRRTYLGRSPEPGWEAIVMSWQEGNRTSIHAHPQFAGYHFADGRFRLEIFEPAGDGTARPVHSAEVEAPCAFFAIGKPGCFDNHIHRITCLSPTGHSLHVYSDDALRGEVYGEADE